MKQTHLWICLKILKKGIDLKTYENRRVVGGDHFRLAYVRRSNLPLQHFLDQLNIDDYVIFKKTSSFKQISYNELLEEKYSAYLFIRKDIYDHSNTMLWFDWIKDNLLTIKYLDKPFPNFNPYEKIIELH